MQNKFKRLYSKILSWISILFSFFSIIYVYSLSSLGWLMPALCLPIVFLNILLGPEKFIQTFPLPKNNYKTYKLLFLFVIVVHLLSSLYGFFLIINYFPINDKSYLFIPSIIFSLFLAGSVADIFYPKKNSYNN